MSEENKEKSVETASNNEYRTDQTPLAAYLLTEGFTLLHTDYSGRFTAFIFENDSVRLTECVRDFESLKAQVNPTIYIRNYQALIKSIKRGY